MNEPISQLMSDIAAFRNMILYYENRILQKEIAIRELLNSEDVAKENPVDTSPPPELTVRDIVMEHLNEMQSGAHFNAKTLTTMCTARYPLYTDKLRDGVRVLLYTLERENVVASTSTGWKKL